MCEEYLLLHHEDQIIKLLTEEDSLKSYSIYLNFIELFENNPELGNAVLKTPDTAITEWNKSVLKVQISLAERKNYRLKKIFCRLHSLPICPELVRTIFPNNEDVGKFLEISGTVVRITAPKLLEFERQYICTKCKYSFSVKANYALKNLIVPPKKCVNPEGCKGTNIVNFGDLDTEYCKDYQEIKVQESVTKLGIGSIPTSMLVTLEDDLVDGCKPGDSVTICGIVKQRWGPLFPGKRSDVEIVLQANYVQVNNTYGSASVTPEIRNVFDNFWDAYSTEPLVGRDIILKSICPQLFGLYFVKLATALVLAGGSHVEDVSATGVRIRSESHLLLVGDPGTGKSHLLRFASKIIPRSVLTTGVGSTAAGLTVTAIKENGEWQLEGGALVMADGGICCIDEFNSMKEHDRTSIHEAMEQQTISVAKASIVCKLSTRCSILAACNPKGNLDINQPLCLNVALASPLLSRFDLILLLRDTVNEEWDSLVADYILNEGHNYSKLTDNTWSLDLLQAYFKIIKKINPILTEDSNTILSSYYQCQRKVDSRNKSRTTVRLLDSLIRLSQGHAKLMYHSKVEVIDAVFAIILVDTAMENDGRLLNLNLNTHSTFSDNPMGDYLEMLEIILNKLNFQELLEKEREHLKLGCSTAKITKSRFFNKNETDCDKIVDFNNDSIICSTQEDVGNILSKIKIKTSDENSQNIENNVNLKQSKNNFKTNKNAKLKKRNVIDLNEPMEPDLITNNRIDVSQNKLFASSEDIDNINFESDDEDGNKNKQKKVKNDIKTRLDKFKQKKRRSNESNKPDANNDFKKTIKNKLFSFSDDIDSINLDINDLDTKSTKEKTTDKTIKDTIEKTKDKAFKNKLIASSEDIDNINLESVDEDCNKNKQKQVKHDLKTRLDKFKQKKRTSNESNKPDENNDFNKTNKNKLFSFSDDIDSINLDINDLDTKSTKEKTTDKTIKDKFETNKNKTIKNNIKEKINKFKYRKRSTDSKDTDNTINNQENDNNKFTFLKTCNLNVASTETNNKRLKPSNKININEEINTIDSSNGIEANLNINCSTEIENLEKPNQILNSPPDNVNVRKKPRKSKSNTASKKPKLDKNINNDLELLNCLPSVNDDIMNFNLNFDDDYSEDCQEKPVKNENINLTKGKTKKSLKDLFGFKPKSNNTVIENKSNSQASLYSLYNNENFDDIDLDL